MQDLRFLYQQCQGKPALQEHAEALASQIADLRVQMEAVKPPVVRLREALARKDRLADDITAAESTVALATQAVASATSSLDLAKAKLAALHAASAEMVADIIDVQRQLAAAMASSDPPAGPSGPRG